MHPSFNISKYINDCIEIGLFKTDGEKFWSESLCRRMKEAFDRAELSRKRKEAAMNRWKKRDEGDQGKKRNEKPEKQFAVDSLVDSEWKRVADAYEQEIGMLPTGTAIDTLVSYYEDMGADAVIVAIRKTNEAQPDVPYKYLKTILESFIKRGVKSGQEAEACCLDFDRRTKRTAPAGRVEAKDEPEQKTNSDDVRWLD